MNDLEWSERSELSREEPDRDNSMAWAFGLSMTALITSLLPKFFNGPVSPMPLIPDLLVTTLLAVGAAVMFMKAALGRSTQLRQTASTPIAGEDRRNAFPQPASKERELLSALRDNRSGITPVEAAMETSLSVREADETLSGLAAGGHLAVESRDGALFYSVPGRGARGLENRG